MPSELRPKGDYLFECSWEVCNKVGGIYTVVKSKAAITNQRYKNYFLVGPYFEEKAKVEFQKKPAPKELSKAFSELKKANLTCYYGTWNIEGEPNVILIDFSGFVGNKNYIKETLWNDYNIDSLESGWDFDEPVIWSVAVGKLIEKLSVSYNNKKIVSHFHEWMAGAALLYLKKHGSKVATVFTTHATMLGRSIAGTGRPLYEILEKINPEEEAYKLKVQAKFLTERACAQNADIFTTVSEITAIEAEKILGRKPEVLVLNGLDIAKFPSVEEASIRHVTNRDKIREFITFYFFPYYTFEIKHTIIFFILGRYEFRNKGIDIFIKALANLNEKLKKENSKRTIVAFFWIPQETHGIKTEQLENKNYYRHIENFVKYNSEEILSNIVYDLVCNQTISQERILSKDFLNALKKDLMRFRRSGNPPICTHNLKDEGNDAIVRSLIESGLDNKEDDPVKAILYPVYLDGSDGLINLPYYDSMSGCHLGIFPSYYEPWGYTPLEAAALAVPSVTSDLAGFGRFIAKKVKDNMDDGIFNLKRFNVPEQDTVTRFTELLYDFSKRDKHQRSDNKVNAIELSKLADWKFFIRNYINAHNKAVDKVY